MLDLAKNDVLVHKKGGVYRVLHPAGINEGDLEPVVVYEACHTRQVWVRPLVQFTTDRFRHINNAGDWLK